MSTTDGMLDKKDNVAARLPVSLLNKLEFSSIGTWPLSFAYRRIFLSLTIVFLNNIVFLFHGSLLKNGGSSGNRTHDLRIKSPMLYLLSYGPKLKG